MTEKFELYKCSVCGNLVQVLLNGAGELVCCGQNMELLQPKNSESDETLNEKHTPEIVDKGDIREIRMDKHPMMPEHYIMFVEAFSKNKNEAQIKYFHPEEAVVMDTKIKDLSAVSYCNIHGLYNDNQKEE